MRSRGVNRFGSMSAFAGHRAGGSGGGGDFLKKWKDTGHYDAWMHTRVLPIALWRHGMPAIVVIEDKTTHRKIAHVWSKNLVCHETEDVLDGQYFTDRDTGARKHPPKRCGVCKLVEWARQECFLFEEYREENLVAIKEKKFKKVRGIDFTTPLFKFEGDDPKETQVIHMGGICNLFKPDKLNDDQKQALKDAGISPKFAWKENGYAKCQYAMCVVSNDHPEDGVKIAVEASSLGDAVKGVINKVIESEERNIDQDPYVIRWKFFKDAPMSEMYDALPMPKIQLTPRIKKLITGDAPEEALEKLMEPFNQQTVRAMLEAHCLLAEGVVPWDDLFPTEAQEKKWRQEDDKEKDAEESAAEVEDPDADSEDKDDEDDEEEFECDNPKCGKAVKASDKKCPHCGHVFDVEEAEEEEEPPKKKLLTRAEALAAKKKTEPSKPSKSKKKDDEDEDEGDGGDDIPF